MDDPITALIRENPTPAIVTLPGPGSAGYDPSVTYGMPTDGQVQVTKNCLFSQVTDAALLQTHQAVATFELADFASQAQAENCSVQIAGVTYTIYKVRQRFLGGAQNGWTLMLQV